MLCPPNHGCSLSHEATVRRTILHLGRYLPRLPRQLQLTFANVDIEGHCNIWYPDAGSAPAPLFEPPCTVMIYGHRVILVLEHVPWQYRTFCQL